MAHIQTPLDNFLKLYKTKEHEKPSHTRIGDKLLGIYGGSYCIPDEKMDDFYELYHDSVFVKENMSYLTECQLENEGVVLVDIDERYGKYTTTRQHTHEHVEPLVNLYAEEINTLVSDTTYKYPIYVFEKDTINTDNEEYVKDGIHIIFGVSIPHLAKEILRDNVIENLDQVFGDLPLTNSYNDLVDLGVARGKTNWQLTGSRKPNNDCYKLRRIFTAIVKNDVIEYEEPIGEIDHLKLIPKMSARNKDFLKLNLTDDVKKQVESMKKSSKKKKTMKISKVNADFNTIVQCQNAFPHIKNEAQCKKIIDFIINYAKTEGNHNIKFAHELVMILDDDYYSPYDMWKKVSWAMRNISDLLYPSWLLFSCKSEKFCWGTTDCYDEWFSSSFNKELAPNIGSLKYWAKKCDFENAEKVVENNVDYYLMKTLKNSAEYDIAQLVYAIYQGEFKCCNIKNKIWYEFCNGRWRITDSGTSLRQALSLRVSKLFHTKVREALEQAGSDVVQQEDNKGERMEAAKLAETAIMWGTNLKKTQWKTNIMKECCEVFFDRDFANKLDTNKNLLCFNNGVLDFENKEFRSGDPNDYVSLCTHTDYIQIDPNNDQHTCIKNEISYFMEQLFPNPNLRRYMWEHLASILKGGNKNQTFNIYTGSGRNGKSKLVELMALVLGDYKGSAPLSLITRERTSIGGLSPEIAALSGARYAVMQEPSKKMKLNEGPMKELVGDDPIQCRALWQDTKTYVPQFKLVVCTNHLFDIQSNDDGTWRRIRVCDFVAKFLDNPSDDPKDNQFKIDRDIDKKFKEWVPIFTAMLVEKVFETDGNVTDCDEVMAASLKYKSQQDHMSGFIKERIQKHATGVIKKTDVKQEFEEWYTELYSGKVPSGRELYDYLSKNLGTPSKIWLCLEK